MYEASGLQNEIDYDTYCAIIKCHNKYVYKYVADGETFELYNGMGRIALKTEERNYKTNRRIDWKTSMEYRNKLLQEGKTPKGPEHPEGIEWYVYFTDPFFTRILWDRSKTRRIRNLKAYSFKPSFTFRRYVAAHLKEGDGLNEVLL